jgi:hypothetical protein
MRCFRETFSDASSGLTATVVRLPLARIGDRSVAYRVTIRGGGGTAYVDFVGILRGRMVISAVFGATGSEFPRALQLRIARAIAGRAR